ncbi:MAG: 2,3-diphosphoglycerate-dependent phosphoglycerate mutase [Pantoea sp. Brub]|nr:2,3-diphosphoglycerate-dependent phosphoglycerate mutase [Pantoea sp. Brub]
MSLINLVLLRHGESQWNSENRFTGWEDIELSDKGHIEAKYAGKLLYKNGFSFDYAYTSLLKRAIHTMWHVLDEINQSWLTITNSWCLNERHYGALQGLNKDKVINKYGEEQVKQWRRSFKIAPPALQRNDKRFSGNDPRYASLNINELPLTESLEMTVNRVIPYWHNYIVPMMKNGKKIIIVAHGNSIRALVKYINNLSEEEIMDVNIPTGIPLIYTFEEKFNVVKHSYLKLFTENT